MSDLFVAAGLVLVIEGLLWALAPQFAMTLLSKAAATPERTLRRAGWAAVCAGVVLVWAIRG